MEYVWNAVHSASRGHLGSYLIESSRYNLKVKINRFLYKIKVQPEFHHEVYHGRFTVL